MKYGELIKKIRVSQNMTLRQFSVLTGCDHGNLSRLEKSFNVSTGMSISPSIDTLKQICDRTNYPFRQFLEESGYIEPVAISSPISQSGISDEVLSSNEQELIDLYRTLPEIRQETLLDTIRAMSGKLQKQKA